MKRLILVSQQGVIILETLVQLEGPEIEIRIDPPPVIPVARVAILTKEEGR